jgi:hypothetical protein
MATRCDTLTSDNERLATQLEARGRHVALLLEDNQRLAAANTALKQQLAQVTAAGSGAWGKGATTTSSSSGRGASGSGGGVEAPASSSGGVMLVRRGRCVAGASPNSRGRGSSAGPQQAQQEVRAGWWRSGLPCRVVGLCSALHNCPGAHSHLRAYQYVCRSRVCLDQ